MVINLTGVFGEGCIEEKENSLELKNCRAEDLKFDDVVNPGDVKEITANNNNFPKLNNEFFGKFKNLESLSLKKCKISEISNNAFQGLTKLKKLYLSGNEITKLDERVFEPLENLEQLYLDENKIEDLDKDFLKYNRNLKVLSLGFNQISTLDDELLFNLKKLEYFSIQENQIEILNKNVFKENKRLIQLNLKNNKIFAIERDTFQHLKELRYLNLEENDCIIKKIGDFHLKINLGEVTEALESCYKIYANHVKSKESIQITTCPPQTTCPTPETSVINEYNNYDSLPDNVDHTEKFHFTIFGLILINICSMLTIAIMSTKIPKNGYATPLPREMNQLQEMTESRVEPGYVEMNAIKFGTRSGSGNYDGNLQRIGSTGQGRGEHVYAEIPETH
jgi:hypothetical protein